MQNAILINVWWKNGAISAVQGIAIIRKPMWQMGAAVVFVNYAKFADIINTREYCDAILKSKVRLILTLKQFKVNNSQ